MSVVAVRRSRTPSTGIESVAVCATALCAVALLALIGTGINLSSPATVGRSADSWADVPAAARAVISRDLGRDQSRFAVKRSGTRLAAKGLGLSTKFGRDGALVRSGSGLSLQLGLKAIGRGRSFSRVSAANPVSRSNTVRYNHFGVKEWYANGPLGLEQGFTVERRVTGSGELTLAVGRVPASARLIVAADGTRVTATALHGASSLRYSDLTAIDSGGQRLRARIGVSGRQILLRVNDAHARYPLRIDPLVEIGGAQLTDNGGTTYDGFGASVGVSADGSTIAVGGTYSNAVYVFSEPASGWQDATPTAELTPSDGKTNDEFGASVAVSADGSTVVVGAPGRESSAGGAYVFSERASGGWQDATQTAELSASGDGGEDRFGASVAISGNGETIVVGAPEPYTLSYLVQGPGAAYVFAEPATGGWRNDTPTADLVASDGENNDGLGSSVAASEDGSTIVLSAPAAIGGEGAVYTFSKPASGGWQSATQTAELTTADGSVDTNLGLSVAISGDGDTIVAAAANAASPVYVFSEPASGEWQDATETADLTDSAGGGLGGAVATISEDGTTVIVGFSIGGSAVVFNEPASGRWQSETWSWMLQGAQVYASTRGVGVSGNGDTMVVAGSGGSVFVYPGQLPEPFSPPTISGAVRQGQTLSEAHGDWSDSPSGYVYQWYDCDNSGDSCLPIADATAQTYELTAADVGHVIRVQEFAFTVAADAAGAISAPTAPVVPPPPANTGAPTITGTAIQGDSLSASPGSWTNSPTGFSYQWERCDSTGKSCQSIGGAISQTYTLGIDDVGCRIVVAVTATNAGGSSVQAGSAATPAVPESGPVGFEIDNGDYATDNPTVTIEAAWPVGAQSILISNNGGFRTDTRTFAPAATLDWKLEQSGSDRLPKTVYLRFLGVGQDDINFTDGIILDQTAPTVQSATVSGPGTAPASASRATKLKKYKLHLKARDQVVGVCVVATSRRRTARGEALITLTSCKRRGILKLARTLDLKLAVAPRYVRVQNSAGDWSRWLKVKI